MESTERSARHRVFWLSLAVAVCAAGCMAPPSAPNAPKRRACPHVARRTLQFSSEHAPTEAEREQAALQLEYLDPRPLGDEKLVKVRVRELASDCDEQRRFDGVLEFTVAPATAFGEMRFGQESGEFARCVRRRAPYYFVDLAASLTVTLRRNSLREVGEAAECTGASASETLDPPRHSAMRSANVAILSAR